MLPSTKLYEIGNSLLQPKSKNDIGPSDRELVHQPDSLNSSLTTQVLGTLVVEATQSREGCALRMCLNPPVRV